MAKRMSGCSARTLTSRLPALGIEHSPLNCKNSDFHRAKTFSSIIAAPIKAWNALLPERESLSLQRARSLSPSDRKYHCERRLPRISGLPIVILAFNYDPIARGYVESLAHPGGNITGVFNRQPELAVKQLQLLMEAFPEKNQLGILWD